MPSTDSPNSFVPFASFRRSIMSIGSYQVHSMDGNQVANAPYTGLDSFQKHVSDCFHDLSDFTADEFLSITWLRKLLDVFLSCQEKFRVLLFNNKVQVSKSPLDRLVSDFFERSIKALDICNATRDGLEKIRLWQKQLEIILCALDCQQRTIGEGQFRRARKSLMDLALLMLDDKESGSVFSHRNRSFGRHNSNKDHSRLSGHSRSLSWSVPRTWSASKQLQSFASSLVPPRGNEIIATNGLAVPVFTMSTILMFVLWVLVAAIPCQDRGLQIHFSVPKQFSWGAPMLLLHDRIVEESKKRERRNTNGLLKEIYEIEKGVRHMTDLVDSAQFPLPEEQMEELRHGVREVGLVFDMCKNELDPLERQVREVFRKIMSCRTEGLEFLNKWNNPE